MSWAFVRVSGRFTDVAHTDMRSRLVVILGDHDLRVANESAQAFRLVRRLVLHPLYDPSSNQYDLALLHLSRPVTYSGGIAPACLPAAPR